MNTKTVAIIGASSDPKKYSNKAIHAFLARGYTVFPVNPKAVEINGLRAYGRVTDIPEHLAMISVYIPPALLLPTLPEIAAKGCDELWLNPGTESPAVLAEAQRLGLKVIQACSIQGKPDSNP